MTEILGLSTYTIGQNYTRHYYSQAKLGYNLNGIFCIFCLQGFLMFYFDTVIPIAYDSHL